MSGTRQLRFGIIGCGGIARFHAKALAAIDEAELAAVTDSSPEQRAAFSADFGIAPVPDVDALLARTDIDAVCICTPSGLHAPLAVQALNAGKHVVVEKPFAITRESMNEVLNAEKRAQARSPEKRPRVSVISQNRFPWQGCPARETARNNQHP